MEIQERINKYLKDRRGEIDDIKITKQKNKDGINLLYARVSKFEEKKENDYVNMATYYTFNDKGHYVGAVIVVVLNPTTVELMYFADTFQRNKGNMTIVSREVIKEVFEDKVYDSLITREGEPVTKIDTIMVEINKDNPVSQKVARKLGFDEEGYLTLKDYKEAKAKQYIKK